MFILARYWMGLGLCLSLFSCSGAGYIAESGVGQWKLFNRARPIQEVLSSPNTTDRVRHGIEMVKQAKTFAITELGLKATKNYETYVALDAPCVSWAVSAAHPLLLEEKKWKFPIVGEVPYLGFFSKEKAEREARRLEETEQPRPDTWVRCVPAFSSLGWFADPLYSSMINGKDRHIVELVVHESLHATVWVSGSVDFNEKLANFVGLEGSLLWTKKQQGENGLETARLEVAGEKVFAAFMQEAVDRYRVSVKNLAEKEEYYRSFPGRYQAFVKARQAAGEKFTPVGPKLEGWNNAALLAYGNYFSDYSIFEKMLASCGGKLGRFVAWIAAVQEKGESGFKDAPEKFLGGLASGGACP